MTNSKVNKTGGIKAKDGSSNTQHHQTTPTPHSPTQQHVQQHQTQNTNRNSEHKEGHYEHDTNHKAWGDEMRKKRGNDTWRIGFQNIGPQRLHGFHPQARKTIDHIRDGEYDVFMFNEHGLYFLKVPAHSLWPMRCRKHFNSSYHIVSNNTKE